MVIADTKAHAKAAAAMVQVVYQPEKAILTIDDAISAKSYLPVSFFTGYKGKGEVEHKCGDAEGVLAKEKAGTVKISGRINTPAQKHFYMETQTAFAVHRPNEFGKGDGVEVWNSTQNPSCSQSIAAQVLGVKQHMVEVKQIHAGGGFGGKLTNQAHVAAAASLGAVRLRRPCRMTLDLQQDMKMTGGREAMRHDYEARVDVESGRIIALRIDIYCQCGQTGDFSGFSAKECAHHYEQLYKIPNISISTTLLKCNITTPTSMRAPGSISGAIGMETIMEHAAHVSEQKVIEIRRANFEHGRFQWSNLDPQGVAGDIWRQTLEESDFEKRMASAIEFNSTHKHIKRGIAIVPMKFPVSAFASAAKVQIYYGGGPMPLDGSIEVFVTGQEIGQGLHTKCAQAAAETLSEIGCIGGVPLEYIHVGASSTSQIPNTGNTGAGITSECCVQAVVGACKTLVENLKNSWLVWILKGGLN